MSTDSIANRITPFIEWAIWVGIAALAWAQTGRFNEEIAEYKYGASGWPKGLCIAMIVGATGQLLLRLVQGPPADDDNKAAEARSLSAWRWIQRIGIFVLPLIYLYFMPTLGFYVSTPIFIAVLLILLEVKNPLTILTVVAIVYGLILALFTRFFYVALPTGSEPPFYDWNNAIIEFVRIGV